jgi:hypothetical protein
VFSATSTGCNPKAHAPKEQLTTDNNIKILFIVSVQIQCPGGIFVLPDRHLKLCTGFDDAKVVILFVKRENDASFSVGTGRDH